MNNNNFQEPIINYHTPWVYNLRKWISIDKIDWNTFCKNPLVIFFLKKHPEYFDNINWWMLSKNPNAVDFLMENQQHINCDQLSKNTHPDAISLLWFKKHYINWSLLSYNPSAIDLLKTNPLKIYWYGIAINPNALSFLPLIDHEKKCNNRWSYNRWDENVNWERWGGKINWELIRWRILSSNPITIETITIIKSNQDKIEWDYMSSNKSPMAISLMEKNIDKVNWKKLCKNPFASSLIEKRLETHPDDIDWKSVSKNPTAIHLLKKHPEKIDWKKLSKNPNPDVLPLLEENQEKIDWEYFSSNPNMFSYDYSFLKNRAEVFKEELVAIAMHPKRITRIIEQTGGELEGFL